MTKPRKSMNEKLQELKREHEAETVLYEQLREIIKNIPLDTKSELMMWLDPLLGGRVDLFADELIVDQMMFLTLRDIRSLYFQRRLEYFSLKKTESGLTKE